MSNTMEILGKWLLAEYAQNRAEWTGPSTQGHICMPGESMGTIYKYTCAQTDKHCRTIRDFNEPGTETEWWPIETGRGKDGIEAK